MKIKFISLALVTTLLLASCGTSTDSGVSLTNYKGKGFTMDVPKSWTEVESKSLPSPKTGSIALALTSPDISSGFASNLVILKDQVSVATGSGGYTSKKYSIVNYALTNGKYKEFTKLDEKEISFVDNDVSNLYIFEAKYTMETPKQKFIQTAKICGDQVYLVTIGLGASATASSTSKYESLAKSFACVK